MLTASTVMAAQATEPSARGSPSTQHCGCCFVPSGSVRWVLILLHDHHLTTTLRGSAGRAPRCPVRSGDVLSVDFGVPVGSTPAMIRPAVVVTADLTLSVYRTTFHVVPVTTNVDRAWASEVHLVHSGPPPTRSRNAICVRSSTGSRSSTKPAATWGRCCWPKSARCSATSSKSIERIAPKAGDVGHRCVGCGRCRAG